MRFLFNLFYQGIFWAPQACCGSGWSDSKMGTAANQGWPGTNNYKHHRGEAYVLRMILCCNITPDWSSKVNILAPYLVSSLNVLLMGEQGWRSGESTLLPPMWLGFDSRTRRHMWVEFVVGSRPCSKRFLSGYSGFPLSSKTNTSKIQFDLESAFN